MWFDLYTGERHISQPGARVLEGFAVHADRVPAFVRGGTVLPKRERPRRATASTHPHLLNVPPVAVAVPQLATPASRGWPSRRLAARRTNDGQLSRPGPDGRLQCVRP